MALSRAKNKELTSLPPVDTAASELAAPRFPTLWAAVLYASATMLLGYRALAGMFLINARSDQYIGGYAVREFAAQSLKSGHGFPQWNPYLQGGLPYIAAMHGDIFYPTFLLRWILPTDVAMTWEFIIHLFLCGLFTYLFLRSWRFGFWPALVGGLAYMLGGSIAGYASPGHDGKLFVSALMPLGLLLLTRAVRDGRRWAWGAFAFTVGLAFLTPHPQLFQYFLLLAGSYTLFLAFSDHVEIGRLRRDVAIRRIALALVCVVIGILIGAVQFWPALIEYKPWSPRAAGHDWATATSYSFPIEETLNWYWPQFTGILDNYFGRNVIHLHSDYFGAAVLMLAGAAFGRSRLISFKRFWLAVGAVSLLWAFGGNTPLYHIIMFVPYTKYLRAPSMMIFVTAFSVAMLAAIGTERVLARAISTRYALWWTVAAAIFATVMTVGGYSVLATAVVESAASGRYPPELQAQAVEAITQQKVVPNQSAAIFCAWRSFFFVALTAALIWVMLKGRLRVRTTAIALCVVIAADLWSIERLYWIFSPPASKLFVTDGAIEAINADMRRTGELGRVLNLPLSENVANELGRTDRAFSGDKLMIFGLRIPVGYHGNELGMYQRLLDADSGRVLFSPQFWRHENVRYIYTAADTAFMASVSHQLHVGPFVKLAGPVRDAAGTSVFAYRVPTNNPLAWVSAAMVKAAEDEALATILDPRFDPRRVSIVDTSATNVAAQKLQTLPQPSDLTTHVDAPRAGYYDVRLQKPATSGQVLVVSDNYFPGWEATSNGNVLAVVRTDYNLIGVPLSSGVTAVRLRFEDRAYNKGRVVTALALVLSLVLWIAGAIIERRPTTQQTIPSQSVRITDRPIRSSATR
ncbi:MAG TPA: hypothetical protein VGJ18_22805 [Gemmatimonadaceae bacterium]